MITDVIFFATLSNNTFFSDGYIHVTPALIEGVFTCDYAKLSLKNNRLILDLCTHSYKIDVNHFTGIVSNFRDETIYSSYSCKYTEETLYVPEKYFLYDSDNKIITLSLISMERSPEKIASILQQIERYREII